MLALGLDLLRRIFEAFPQSLSPQSERGVVLIDELDAHLHPKWQQQIGGWLLSKFPNLQFIIATHSPFLAQVSRPSGNVILEQTSTGVKKREGLPAVASWRADQILTEIFGLETTRNPAIEKQLQRYLELTQKSREVELTGREVQERAQLQFELGPLPPGGETRADRSIMAALGQAVDQHAKDLREIE